MPYRNWVKGRLWSYLTTPATQQYMPYLNGYQTLLALKRQADCQPVPVVMGVGMSLTQKSRIFIKRVRQRFCPNRWSLMRSKRRYFSPVSTLTNYRESNLAVVPYRLPQLKRTVSPLGVFPVGRCHPNRSCFLF